MTKTKKLKNSRNNDIRELVRLLVILGALCLLLFSAWRLYGIYHGYHAASQEYDGLKDEFTHPGGGDASFAGQGDGTSAVPREVSGSGENAGGAGGEASPEEGLLIEDAAPPLSADWASLKAVNSDIVGWIYVDAEPAISYPVCRGEDNDYYLHRTFRREDLFAGSIFMDCMNAADFSDPNTVVYGHNMKNGSMFGMLKYLRLQETYDAAPYFWILTPEGNYRYHVYAAMETPVDSEAYNLFYGKGPGFLSWEKRMQAASEVGNSVPLSETDYTVTLSTCTTADTYRCVVMGKLVSSDRPRERDDMENEVPAAADTDG
ncbi:MAG: class B sortase [Lachnospiraceae bacterium]|nr:class B sortase [Lachnospiraceae bacterium]